MDYSIHVIRDKKYKLYFACLFINGTNNGAITFAKTAAQARAQANRAYPDFPVY